MPCLDRNLRHLTGYQLRRANSSAMPWVNMVLAEFGLRRATYSSLDIIVSSPGLNQGQLADALAIERPNMVQIVDQLESNGLVERTKSDADRRAYALRPKPKGCALHRAATKALTQLETQITQGLSDTDMKTLARCLAVIEQNANDMEARDVRKISIA